MPTIYVAGETFGAVTYLPDQTREFITVGVQIVDRWVDKTIHREHVETRQPHAARHRSSPIATASGHRCHSASRIGIQ